MGTPYPVVNDLAADGPDYLMGSLRGASMPSFKSTLLVTACMVILVLVTSLRSSVTSVQTAVAVTTSKIAQLEQQLNANTARLEQRSQVDGSIASINEALKQLAANTNAATERLDKRIDQQLQALSHPAVSTGSKAPVPRANRNPCAGLKDIWTKCFTWITEDRTRCSAGNYQANCALDCCQRKHEQRVTVNVGIPTRMCTVEPADWVADSSSARRIPRLFE